MKNLKYIVITLLLFVSLQVFSQDIIRQSGDLNFLKGETKIRVEYDYSNMAVGEYSKEEDYIKMKMAEADKGAPGNGAKWLAAWKGDRTKDFEPGFEAMINKKLKPLSFGNAYTNTNFTLIVTTTFLEPGFYITGMIQKKAEISVVYTFVDSKDHNKVLAKFSSTHLKSINTTYAYDLAYRVKGAYEKAAMMLAKQIKKAK